MGKRLNHNDVKQYFEERGCELLDEYVNNKTSMRYRCKCGTITRTNFNSYRKKLSLFVCSKCSSKINGKKRKGSLWAVEKGRLSLLQTHPEIAKQWHPTKNGNLNPSDISFGSNKKIWWECRYGHEWLVMVCRRFWKDGKNSGISSCPHCKKIFGNKFLDKPRVSDTHPDLILQWHPTKNGDVLPSHIVSGSDKYAWQCPVAKDHVWKAVVSERIKGHGCPCCANRKVVLSNCLATTHPELAKQWHPTKNDNLTPFMVTSGSHKKIWWKCSVTDDHEWITSVTHRTNGRGCPCCSGHKVVFSTSIVATHPDLVLQWHPTKNDNLKPEHFSAGSGIKVWWQCNKDEQHVWNASIGGRIGRNTGCPLCNESKGELKINEFLKDNKIAFEREKGFESCRNIRPLYFDFVIEIEGKIKIIEFQGIQHYEPVNFGGDKALELFARVQHNDNIKKEWCKKNKVPLLEIPYWEFDEMKKLLENFCET